MTPPHTITIDGQTVDLYETQVAHPATGMILWASTSGVIACHDLEGLHVIGRVDPKTGHVHRPVAPAIFSTQMFNAFCAAHIQAIALETFALVQRAKGILERWKAKGFTLIARTEDTSAMGRWYPYTVEGFAGWSVGGTAVNERLEIGSPETIEALVRSLREGWKYDT